MNTNFGHVQPWPVDLPDSKHRGSHDQGCVSGWATKQHRNAAAVLLALDRQRALATRNPDPNGTLLVSVQIAFSNSNTRGCAPGIAMDQKLALDFNARGQLIQVKVAVSGLSKPMALTLIT